MKKKDDPLVTESGSDKGGVRVKFRYIFLKTCSDYLFVLIDMPG